MNNPLLKDKLNDTFFHFPSTTRTKIFHLALFVSKENKKIEFMIILLFGIPVRLFVFDNIILYATIPWHIRILRNKIVRSIKGKNVELISQRTFVKNSCNYIRCEYIDNILLDFYFLLFAKQKIKGFIEYRIHFPPPS